MAKSGGAEVVMTLAMWMAACTAGAASPKPQAAATAHLDLPCPAVEGSVGLDIDVEGEEAVLRVEYPRPFASYRGRPERGVADTRIYFDVDNDVRSGLEEWDDESLKLKGIDYSVEVFEHPAESRDQDVVGGSVLVSKVYKHEGGMANATGSFKSEYLGNVAIHRVELYELHAAKGSTVKTLFMVGKCGPVSQNVVLKRAGKASRGRKS
jgi:hypothetical protein